MTEIFLTIFFISVLLFFLGSGIWVALSMIGVSAIGMMLFTSRPVGDAMATTIWGTSSSWTLTALPLFVWMGEILFRTRLSENLFKDEEALIFERNPQTGKIRSRKVGDYGNESDVDINEDVPFGD